MKTFRTKRRKGRTHLENKMIEKEWNKLKTQQTEGGLLWDTY